MPAASTYGFLMTGIAPTTDPAWADPRARMAFWEQAAAIGARVWKEARAKGLDKDGRPMARIHPWTAEDRDRNKNSVTGQKPYSPMGRAKSTRAPLQPAGPRSRVISLLRWEARDDGVWYYWARDAHTGRDWGEILARHAAGFTQRFYRGWGVVPGRNVLGISRQELAQVAREMGPWWSRNRHRWDRSLAPAAISARTAAQYGAAGSKVPPVPVPGGRGPVSGLLARGLRRLLQRVGLASIGGG